MPPINAAWAPAYLVRALFGQAIIWITAGGEFVYIDQMDREHALNTLLMLERVRGDLRGHGLCTTLEDTALYRALKHRVLRAIYVG